MRVDDLVITIAYVSIPIQLFVSLYQYPRLTDMPRKIVALLVLFALFILCCGAGHMLRCMGNINGQVFAIVNTCTAIISLMTAVFLLPMVPNLMNSIDEGLENIRMNEQILESKRKLLTFMAFLCHEIRNPLFAITSTISFLEDEELTPDQQRSLRSISQSASLMLRLVNDVLDLSKLESGKLELEERDFNLRDLLHNVASGAETQILQRHEGRVRFHFVMSPTIPALVSGDSVRVLQILYNLLSNAAKFTSNGEITLRADIMCADVAAKEGYIRVERLDPAVYRTSTPTPGGGGDVPDFSLGLLSAAEEGLVAFNSDTVVVKLEVKDTGIGIPKDRLDNIFEAYTQNKLSQYRMHGGTGLGLSILQQLSIVMGGSIHVSSVEGKGSTFTVYLPLRLSMNAAVANMETARMLERSVTFSRLPDQKRNQFDKRAGKIEPTLFPKLIEDTLDALILDPLNDDGSIPRKKLVPSKPANSANVCAGVGKITSSPKIQKLNLPPNEAVVLVVDDNAVNRKLIGRMLDHFNVQYETAVDGLQAVNIISKSRNATGDPSAPQFGLILMDLCMPVMGGIEAIEVLRKQKLQLPIVALTANALDVNKDQALQSGASAFVTKPILRQDLYTLCRQFLLSEQDPVTERTEDINLYSSSHDQPSLT